MGKIHFRSGAEEAKNYLAGLFGQAKKIEKIRGEASLRYFYRLYLPNETRIALVYPGANRDALDTIARLTAIYQRHGLCVPSIIEKIDDRCLVLSDVGRESLQHAYRRLPGSERQKLLNQISFILTQIQAIPLSATASRLDGERIHKEFDFFMSHFAAHYLAAAIARPPIAAALDYISRQIAPLLRFAHRDFHSRNMQVYNGRIYLVDFQDSLQAPPYYDLVSLLYDSYLDLGQNRALLLRFLTELGWDIDTRQLRLTALQRNIKALGTFGFQVYERSHPAYRRYMPRTVHNILGHLRELNDPALAPLAQAFSTLNPL